MYFKFLLIILAISRGFSSVLHNGEIPVHEQIFNRLHGGPPELEGGETRANVKTLWIEQKLDQFDEAEERTWQMRYMSNDQFYEEGGPLFIFVGGEWSINEGNIIGGHMYDMAREHNGYLFYTEHRYYGQSRPLSDLSNENLKYLHVRQALADLAHFIRTMKQTIPGMSNSKAILVGGSYSATMVTWFKKLYPDLATGCWASSAPLFAKVDFVEYKEVMGNSIRLLGGESCYKRIENGFAEMESMFANKRGAELKAMFKLCSNFNEDDDLDLWTFFSEISDIFAGLVQAHSGQSIQNACRTIMDAEDDITGVINYLHKELNPKTCIDLAYKAILNTMSNSAYTNSIMRQWMYQTCNEYGWYQTSGSRNQPFGTKFPVALYIAMCYDAYGGQFSNSVINEKVNTTNELFGGLEPQVENVYLTHGHIDPWRAMGIQDAEQATVIPGYAHCADLGSISNSDTPEMRASKEKVAQLVREWLAD